MQQTKTITIKVLKVCLFILTWMFVPLLNLCWSCVKIWKTKK